MRITVRRDTGRNGLRHRVQIRDHVIGINASPGAGGEDAGAEPHDLYDAALGACKALTLLACAKRKGIPVDRNDNGERQGTCKLKASLRISGDLSEAQRDELMRVAGKCPVHQLMTEVTTEIETVRAT